MIDKSTTRYGSDLIVDLLIEEGTPYVALNPGASFRGLHDSLVNRHGAPKIITCPHEKLAVNLAHGYAKATGKPMVTLLHNVVGLLHASFGIFTAYLDRAPLIVLGGAGPMDTTRRRPRIDWTHTANIQGEAVRAFTKWDDQPSSVAAFPEAFARARRVALKEPAGPVYLALDADLQEQEIGGLGPRRRRPSEPSRIGADEDTLSVIVDALMNARRPVIIAGYSGRDPAAFEQIPLLADALAAGVIDTHIRLNMPNRHPLSVDEQALADADLVLLLDLKDRSEPLTKVDQVSRLQHSLIQPEASVIDIGFNDLHTSSWIHHFGSLRHVDIELTADTSLVLPRLLDSVQSKVANEDEVRASERAKRRRALASLHDRLWSSWTEQTQRAADERPVAVAQLAQQVWEGIRDFDWVLASGTANGWATRTWDFDRAYRHPGRGLGAATQIGLAMGVALAHRHSGRLVVDIQPDGDLMFDAGALWIASAHHLPLLVVMFNNRAYYNDWQHQLRMAQARGTDQTRAHIGVAINDPAPDFATLASSLGWYSEGPIDDPALVRSAVRRAAHVVLERRQPALIDVVCQFR